MQTGEYYADGKLVHELFEAQVRRTPDKLAIVCPSGRRTFEALNDDANKLSIELTRRGAEPDQVIGICAERDTGMMIGLMGILKAGGAYLPLDPEHPVERLRYMIEEAMPKLILVEDRLRGALPQTAAEMISLDSIAAGVSNNEKIGERKAHRPEHLAYVIYTSGSTGEPKGVMIEHRHVCNLWQGLERIYDHTATCDRVALNGSFSFDGSVKQFIQLLSGRTVFVVPQEHRLNPYTTLQFLEDYDIGAVDCTPSQLRTWISAGLLERNLQCLQLVLIGGEPIDANLWNSLASHSNTAFVNVYGPTECTVDATFGMIECGTTRPNIGRAMLNRRVFILGRDLQPMNVGITGEIYIGGQGISRGYLRQPALTADRFVPDPFVGSSGDRLYRSGDMGRLQSDGNIECLGRNDRQVKLRGYRIELAEIEAQLLAHKHVRAAVVVLREDAPGERRLVAYVTQDDRCELKSDVLQTHLKSLLPEYMLPKAILIIGALPLTPNGKLDYRALPVPIAGARDSAECDPPRSALERELAEVWQELLHVERIGRQDHFFELGGDSLMTMPLMVRIAEKFGVPIHVSTILTNPILCEMAADIERLVVDSARNVAVALDATPAWQEETGPP
ncbi:non-ribosomal peptide synthetase [Steroidobacter agaridevorans]|nr:non-ribosomal peptide synthetase [Steroidobacter agaridevorans]